MQPRNDTEKTKKLNIPRVPEHVFSHSLSLHMNSWEFTWGGRFSAKSFRDDRNTVIIPSSWTNNLALNKSWNKYKAGVAVYNIANVMKIKTHNVKTSQDETLPRSDVDGVPLAGRTWKLFVQGEL